MPSPMTNGDVVNSALAGAKIPARRLGKNDHLVLDKCSSEFEDGRLLRSLEGHAPQPPRPCGLSPRDGPIVEGRDNHPRVVTAMVEGACSEVAPLRQRLLAGLNQP